MALRYEIYEGESYKEALDKMYNEAYKQNILEYTQIIKKFTEVKRSFFGLRKKETCKVLVGISENLILKKKIQSKKSPQVYSDQITAKPSLRHPEKVPDSTSVSLLKENEKIKDEVSSLKSSLSEMEALIKTQFAQMQEQMLSQKVREEVSQEKKVMNDVDISKKNIQWTEEYLTEREFSRELIKDALEHLIHQNKDVLIDKSQILLELRNFLNKSIAREDISIDNYKNGNTILFAGPTGVGKTITIVKMAAHIAAMRQKTMRFLSVDRYKVGADSQLKTYSEYLKAPFHPISQEEELFELLRQDTETHFTFIDTAGKSPRETIAIQELAGWIQKAHKPIDVHLVVSSTTKPADLHFIVEKYSLLNFGHIIATKLDETVYLGSILSIIYKTKRPLSFVTNGQEVPQDFEIANVDKMIADSLK